MTLYRTLSSQLIDREITSFGLIDERGRAIGYAIAAYEMSYETLPERATYGELDNPRFVARTSVTRDGEGFGAITRDVTGDTAAEVMAEARNRRQRSLERYRRKYGGAHA